MFLSLASVIPNSLLDSLSSFTSGALHALSSRLRSLSHTLSQGHILFTILALLICLVYLRIELVFATLLNEGCQVLYCAGTGEGDGLCFGTGREELDGGKALDLIGYVVGCGIDFGDGDFGGRGVEGS